MILSGPHGRISHAASTRRVGSPLLKSSAAWTAADPEGGGKWRLKGAIYERDLLPQPLGPSQLGLSLLPLVAASQTTRIATWWR